MDIKKVSKEIYTTAKKKGFWDTERNTGELLMLVTSELGEALEAHRTGKFADIKPLNKKFKSDEEYAEVFKTCCKDTFEDEISDAVIRLFDIASGYKIDLEKHIELKMRYNATRPRLHGKRY
jgi:NTP pyrophosphatase (non-canonical NTP hydrolase)